MRILHAAYNSLDKHFLSAHVARSIDQIDQLLTVIMQRYNWLAQAISIRLSIELRIDAFQNVESGVVTLSDFQSFLFSPTIGARLVKLVSMLSLQLHMINIE